MQLLMCRVAHKIMKVFHTLMRPNNEVTHLKE